MRLPRSLAYGAYGGALVVLATASMVHAQAPASTNPLDTIPEKMPFAEPYGAPIDLAHAQTLIAAGMAESQKRGWPMNIAVYDSGANLVAFVRMDGAQIASVAIAEHKARAAVEYRRKTRAFEDGVQLHHFNYITTLDDVIASRGGIPLIQNGKIIGSVGCSGGAGSQDEVICEAAAAALK